MNAESTPIRKNRRKVPLEDALSEIAPIEKDKISEGEEKVILREHGNGGGFPGATKRKMKSVTKSHIQSQKFKKSKGLESKVFESNVQDSLNNSVNSDKYLANLLDKIVGNELDDSFKLEKLECDNQIQLMLSSSINKLSNHCNSQSEEIYNNSKTGSKVKSDTNESGNNISQILSLSDVMKWSDKSLMPDHSKLNLSNQIKQKLLGNVSNNKIVKSQTSGWSQINVESCPGDAGGPFYGLPSHVGSLYERQRGIKELYCWQKECLNLEAVKLHKNLVYALPTSGGKTLVAEMLILREIICNKRNVLLIVPFVSIVQEKMRDFSQFAVELGFLVEEYAAGKGVIPPRKRRRKNSLLIATIEKALIVVNSLIEAKRLNEFGLLVVDELHLLSEEGRGPILETLLTKMLYMKEKIQIIGMTATIGNLDEIATFLKAESYSCNFRPVQLSEYVKCGNKIYQIQALSGEMMKEVRSLGTSSPESDPDGIGELVREVIPGDSVLIFCPTKKNCENVALLLTKILSRELTKNKTKEKESLYRALMSETNDQMCPTLKKTIGFGVAYHHSGLTSGERKLLEEAFRDGTLSVICCTSTLAAGVNLPAKRVILRSPYIGKDFISLSKYKQMVGRAGRAGFGTQGESYLVCQAMDSEKVNELLCSRMDDSVSKMDSEACKNLVLSAIGLGVATTRRTLRELLTYSLLHIQKSRLNKDVNEMTDACIARLYKQGALKVKGDECGTGNEGENSKLELNITQSKKCVKIGKDSPLVVSRLGRAAMKGGLSLEKAHELYKDLVKAQSNFVLLTNLHLLFLVTPYEILSQIKANFSIYFNVYMQLDSKEVHTAKIIGITEFIMSKLATGVKPKNIPESVLNRFYVSLILNELWKEQTVWDVAMLFQLPRGLVQTLMVSASTFANSVLRFCEELEELWSFKSLLTDFTPRLAHCCSAELLPLMDLPAVKRGRARQLYDAGFKNLNILANARPAELVGSIDHMPTRVASQIIAAAKLLLMEKAENLKEEADEVLEGLAGEVGPKEA